MRDFPPINRAAEAEALQTLFFVDGEHDGKPCRVSRANYLEFLSLRGAEAKLEVQKLKQVLDSLPLENLESDVVRLLTSVNWRYHNIACVTMAAGFASEVTIAALWERIATGSWTSPQLVATAAYVDRDFPRKAVLAVSQHETYFKSIVSLAAVLEENSATLEDCGKRNTEEARSLDRDNAGKIATGWLRNLKEAFD
jgi:inactivated superfamily I helicase